MSKEPDDPTQGGQGATNSTYAAVARTLTAWRGVIFFKTSADFQAFQESFSKAHTTNKVSGWHSLRGLAASDGTSLSPALCHAARKDPRSLLVIPRHFVPPLLVNAALGTVLWTAYSGTSYLLNGGDSLEAHPIATAAISGAIAGGAQAIVAAPAENARLAIEGGTAGGGWSHAWKEVLRGTVQNQSTEKKSLREIRQVRGWMMEVRDMAGRGWNGWGWGLAKDVCGFSVFFTIFEVTRRLATELKILSVGLVRPFTVADERPTAIQRNLPRTVHGATLVAGGVTAGLAYEVVCRPWDVARRLAHLDRIQSATTHRPRHHLINLIMCKIRDDGLLFFFRNATGYEEKNPMSLGRQRLLAVARTLGRVGPWGVGFLVWEAFGPGIS
ncbi:hypothetical protein H4582DRAFT_1905626 [Lactarius indigo]|nr:hypothetical protein H4582DRAFT_1905626 [Lactarius indigo]